MRLFIWRQEPVLQVDPASFVSDLQGDEALLYLTVLLATVLLYDYR